MNDFEYVANLITKFLAIFYTLADAYIDFVLTIPYIPLLFRFPSVIYTSLQVSDTSYIKQ